MKKIPTLFVRDPVTRRHVLNEVTPGCEWVLAGEGQASRKFDGTCVMYDGTDWWARREVKPDKAEPDGWVEVDHDETTDKRIGWEPITEQWTFSRPFQDAYDAFDLGLLSVAPSFRTYELCGPKINGNPEHFLQHQLIPHGLQWVDAPRDYDGLRDWLQARDYEGIVWAHPDGRMAKLKRRDFHKKEA